MWFLRIKNWGRRGGNIFWERWSIGLYLGIIGGFGFSGFLRVLGVNVYINMVHAYKLTNTNWLPRDTVKP